MSGAAAGFTVAGAAGHDHTRRPHLSHISAVGTRGDGWACVGFGRGLCPGRPVTRAGFRGALGAVAEQPGLGFGGLLQRLRAEAGLTQEELAQAAGLSPRSVSDLERGIHRTARQDTARLLADALGLDGPERAVFVAAARGRAPAGEAGDGPLGGLAAVTRTLPRDIAAF